MHGALYTNVPSHEQLLHCVTDYMWPDAAVTSTRGGAAIINQPCDYVIMMNKSLNKLNGVQVEVQVYILLFVTALLDK